MSSDKIIIQSLKVQANIGCSAEERSAKQRLELNIEIFADLAEAGATGDLSRTICYHTVCNETQSLISSKNWILLEELAEAVTTMILEKFMLTEKVFVEIRKFVVPSVEYTAIQITRNRKK